ncbi:phospho-sugar mutase [bacterium]|nr:phospho-sugar mutase [bacterium]
MDNAVEMHIQEWLSNQYDKETRKEIQTLVDKQDYKELTDRFYKDLDFGTGGLRGVIGAGTNRMNIYTIRRSTQGLASYIIKQGAQAAEKGVAIAYDSRYKSPEFALEAALVLAGNGIKTYLFDKLHPTPLLSFAVRRLNAQAGIVVTASHNPKEYNGYKVYWDDGAQVVPPHDVNIINEVRSISSLSQVKIISKKEAVDKNLLQYIGDEIDEAYLEKAVSLSINPQIVSQTSRDLKIVFTPLHGTGTYIIPRLLDKLGYKNVFIVKEQQEPDCNFSTVKSPNPEESAALALAIKEAKTVGADIVMATDPDADRIGIAVRDEQGKYVLLSGNQTGCLLIYYILSQLKEKEKLPENAVVIKTIVTTELQRKIAKHFGVECIDVLTGFKYITEKIRNFENNGTKDNPTHKFIAGGEESYGYLVGTYVRDKDAVITAAMLAELTAYAKAGNTSLYKILIKIYEQFGLYSEKLKSIVYKGKEGMDTIAKIMDSLRNNPPKTIGSCTITHISDYKKNVTIEPTKNEIIGTIDLPPSNVLAFHLIDGTLITIRPSGTEPKIKIYLSAVGKINGKSYQSALKTVTAKLDKYLQIFLNRVETIVSA